MTSQRSPADRRRWWREPRTVRQGQAAVALALVLGAALAYLLLPGVGSEVGHAGAILAAGDPRRGRSSPRATRPPFAIT